MPGWTPACSRPAGFLLCFKLFLRPVVLYAAFVRGFRYQLLRITVGGFFGCPAYSAAYATGLQWRGAGSRASAETTLAPFVRESEDARNRLQTGQSSRIAAPRVAWKTVIAVVLAHRPGRDLRPHRHAARLHSRSGHHADLRRAAAGVALHSGSRVCLPGALPDGRRDWPARLQPSWSGRHGPVAGPHRRLPALLSLCRRAGQFALSPPASLFPGCARGRGAGQHPHPCRRRHLAWAAQPLEAFRRLRPVGRTVPPWRCRQSPCRDGLRQHAWLFRRG